MTKSFYPVIIPTLCRYEHLRRLIQSLQHNTHAENTELIIGLDYPPADKYREGYNKIKNYLPTVIGFKKVTILEAAYNLGASGNFQQCVNHVRKLGYDAYIFSEDDNEFSPCFLDYMDKGLEIFKNEKRISSICGYSRVKISDSDVYFAKNMSAWGYATWFEKEKDINKIMTIEAQKKVLLDLSISWRVLRRKPSVLKGVIANVFRGELHGDVSYELYNIINDTFCVYPAVSLVKNWGNDGSGLHCKSDGDFYEKQEISTLKTFDFPFTQVIKENRKIINEIEKLSGNTFYKNVGYMIAYFLYYFFRFDFVNFLQKLGIVVKL